MKQGSVTPSAFAGLGRVGTTQRLTPPKTQEKQPNSQAKKGGDENALNNLLRNFGQSIGLEGLELEQNRCSLLLGEGDEAVQITMEIAQDGSLCFYTIIDKNQDGIAANIKELVANQPGAEDGTYLSLNSAGTTLFVCLNSDLLGLNPLDFENLVRNFYMSVQEWRRRYERMTRPLSASTALLHKPAAQDKKFKMDRYLDKATGFLAIAYIIYRMGGILA